MGETSRDRGRLINVRRITRRHLILTPATTLVVAGFLDFLIVGTYRIVFSHTSYLVWIKLPWHGYRIRLMLEEAGWLQIRTYFGTWQDTYWGDHLPEPLLVMLLGYAFLAALLPEQFRKERSARRITAGHCGQCNYDLTANTTGVCPECGTKSEPRPTRRA